MGISPRVHRLSVGRTSSTLTAATMLGAPPPVTGGRTDLSCSASTQIAVELSGLDPRPAAARRRRANGSNNRADNN